MKGIIFDLDGVICSTDKYHYLAWKRLADSLGIYFDEKINDRLRGVSRMESLNIVLEKADRAFNSEEKALLAEKKNTDYRELLAKMSLDDLSVEVAGTLLKLRLMGYKLAIGSSSKNAKLILGRIGLGDFFDEVADGTDIKRSKPDPEVFLCAAKKLGLLPSDCLVVEDANSGIEAATLGGFKCAGIGKAAEDERTTYPLTRFSDLLTILGE